MSERLGLSLHWNFGPHGSLCAGTLSNLYFFLLCSFIATVLPLRIVYSPHIHCDFLVYRVITALLGRPRALPNLVPMAITPIASMQERPQTVPHALPVTLVELVLAVPLFHHNLATWDSIALVLPVKT